MDTAVAYADEIEDLCRKLRALSVETRLHILSQLAERNLCVGALARHLRLTQGAVSQHLKVLREAGLVVAERNGYYVHYRVDEQAVTQLQQELDRMLERVRRGHTSEELGSDTADVQCRKRKEKACVSGKRKAVAEGGAM